MIKIVEGNLLEADVDIICHQVNCQGVMGSGIARSIREMYPEAYKYYKALCDENKTLNKSTSELLGNCQTIECHNGRYVANLFGQNYYGRDGKQYTDYKALEAAFRLLAARASHHNETVGIPYAIGCGLGGGDWDIVYVMIDVIFKDCNVIIYKLK